MPGLPPRLGTGGLSTGTATDDPVSERKFVTILRADIVRSTDLVAELDPEEAVSRLEPVLTAMRAAVHQFGGVVSKEMGDGLAAVFGAPVADDNHAPLACHAALELVHRVAALGDPSLQIRIGLHSGLAVMYVVSSEFSKVYEIGGPASHLAARLEASAEPGEIYASEACQKLSEGHIRFEDVGRKALKGFAEPIPVYRVVAAGESSRWGVRRMRSVSRFVGRSPDMALLRRAAQDALAAGRTVCLTGDPGIGKSRLVHEFVQELRTQGWNRRGAAAQFAGCAIRRAEEPAPLDARDRTGIPICRSARWVATTLAIGNRRCAGPPGIGRRMDQVGASGARPGDR